MDRSKDEALVETETVTDPDGEEVIVTHYKYHPTRILEMSKKRMVICNNCDHLSGIKTCGLCKCFMPAKTAIPFAACPDGKWEEEV
jgi:hypothetical protein